MITATYFLAGAIALHAILGFVRSWMWYVIKD